MSILSNTKDNVLIKTISQAASKPLFWIVSFSIATALAAQVAVPVKPVPFTLQTMMVILSGAFLGSRNGAYSQMLYLAAGVAGLPVFAGGAFGPAVLFGPTGGYLLAFPIGAFLTGLIAERYGNYFMIVLAMFLGNLLIVLLGSLYLNIFFLHNISEALFAGAALFTVWGVVKVFAASAIFFGFKKVSDNKKS